MSSDTEGPGCGRCLGALLVIAFLIFMGIYCAFPVAQSVYLWVVQKLGPGLGTVIGIVAGVIVFIIVMVVVIRIYS